MSIILEKFCDLCYNSADLIIQNPIKDPWCGISKIIHVTGPCFEKLGENVIASFSKTLQDNPGYEMWFWDDAAILALLRREFEPRVVNAFLSACKQFGIVRGDIGRYAIVFVFGGRYIDIKAAIAKDGLKKLFELSPGSYLLRPALHCGMPSSRLPRSYLCLSLDAVVCRMSGISSSP